MTRRILVPDGAYAVLCEMAARMRQETGRAASFADVVDKILEGNPDG